MATTPPRQGPALTIAGSCEGCAWLRVGNTTQTCTHSEKPKGPTGFAIVAMKASHESWNVNELSPGDCPLLPAARLALARGIVAAADDDMNR